MYVARGGEAQGWESPKEGHLTQPGAQESFRVHHGAVSGSLPMDGCRLCGEGREQ